MKNLKLHPWIDAHKPALIILTALTLIILTIHFFGWWEALGLLYLKFGLGANIVGAKTFTHAIVKVGGKKAIAAATATMLTKRHIIDLFSKFFTKHSVNRYKKNLLAVFSKKFHELYNSPPIQRVRAFGSMLLSIPVIYFFWTKVLGTAIQKFVYALIFPLLSMIWRFISTGFNIISFIIKVLMLNIVLDALNHYSWGRKFLYLIDKLVSFIEAIFNFLNTLLKLIGFNPKQWLIKKSQHFNRWLEDILDKGLSHIVKMQNRRDRYINIVEQISIQRFEYAQKKRLKQSSFIQQTKKLFIKKVLKRKTWQEIREKRKERFIHRQKLSSVSRRKKYLSKKNRNNTLLLPFHNPSMLS
jgi:hypothetical protein